MTLPLDLDLLQKRREIPEKLAQLSYMDPEKAIQLLRKWGEKQVPIAPLYEEIIQALNSNAQKKQLSSEIPMINFRRTQNKAAHIRGG
jgi:hypothetical protein